MGKSNSAIDWIIKQSSGYSLVELMVVIGVIGAVGVMTFFGMKSFNRSQSVSNVQKEFVSNLRAVQNRVDNGDVLSSGKVVQEISIPANGSNSYSINGTSVPLPNGITLTNSTNGPLTICFADRNLFAYDSAPAHRCAGCISGVGFVCRGSNATSSQLTVTFVSSVSNSSQVVTINGAGMRVTEINTGP